MFEGNRLRLLALISLWLTSPSFKERPVLSTFFRNPIYSFTYVTVCLETPNTFDSSSSVARFSIARRKASNFEDGQSLSNCFKGLGRLNLSINWCIRCLDTLKMLTNSLTVAPLVKCSSTSRTSTGGRSLRASSASLRFVIVSIRFSFSFL